MPVPFYDNTEDTPIDSLDGFVVIERVYCLDWHDFEDAHWQSLERIYQGLPGAVRVRDVPYWFGDNEDVPPFLWASVEPPGLQVCGMLRVADWQAWDEQFRSEADGLPIWEME